MDLITETIIEISHIYLLLIKQFTYRNYSVGELLFNFYPLGIKEGVLPNNKFRRDKYEEEKRKKEKDRNSRG